jgi:hypothetical protein
MAQNKLYYGDNLDVLRRYVRDESVDLVYLDSPFKSQQDYNVLFAFEDTWEWNDSSFRPFCAHAMLLPLAPTMLLDCHICRK